MMMSILKRPTTKYTISSSQVQASQLTSRLIPTSILICLLLLVMATSSQRTLVTSREIPRKSSSCSLFLHRRWFTRRLMKILSMCMKWVPKSSSTRWGIQTFHSINGSSGLRTNSKNWESHLLKNKSKSRRSCISGTKRQISMQKISNRPRLQLRRRVAYSPRSVGSWEETKTWKTQRKWRREMAHHHQRAKPTKLKLPKTFSSFKGNRLLLKVLLAKESSDNQGYYYIIYNLVW